MSGEIEPIQQTDNSVIPGLTTNGHRSYLKQKKPTLGIFTKGQYDKSGLNGGLVGLTGNLPLGKNGNLSAYVGGGNIFQAGIEYSYTGQIANSLFVVGSAGLEGTVSFTDKTQHDFSFSDNTNKSHYLDGELIESHTEIPFDGQILYEGQEVSHPDIIAAETKHMVTLNTKVQAGTSVNNSVSLPNNQIKGVIKGELRYGNDNFYVGAGIKLDAKTKLAPETKYDFGDTEISTNNEATVEYSQHHIEIGGHYDENFCNENHHAWTYKHKNIDFSENVDLNNINFNDAQNTAISLEKPSFSISPLITAGYKKNDFTGALELDLQGARVVGSYNLSQPITSKIAPNRLYRQLTQDKAYMNLSLSGQSEDDVNSITVNLDGKAPLNDIGTSIDAGFGAGNAVRGWIGVNQNIPMGDNFSANIGLGAKGTISLKDTEVYTDTSSGTANTSDLAPINYDDTFISPNGFDIDMHIHNQCTYNNEAFSTVDNSITVPKHNIYASGTLGVTYTNDRKNFSAGVNVTGGVRGKLEPYSDTRNYTHMEHNATYERDPYYIFGSGTDLNWVDEENPTALTGATSIQSYHTHIHDNIQVERNINTQTTFKPTFNPYTGVSIGTEYQFLNTNWSVGGQVGTTWDLGPEITNNGINFMLNAKCRIK